MTSLKGFDANEVEPQGDLPPLPAGKYEAVIINSENKPTKAGTGSYLELTFQIISGEYENRLLWARLNLDNPNATAVKIARGELSAICRAVSVMQPEESTDLHDLPLIIHVRCKKRDDTEEITNEIKAYSARNAGPKNPPPPQATSATPPWRR